tara:strand:+ start:33795 stop:35474 length:1680 start_codon:yes stop_codon:yes gene_type:complete
MEESTSKTKKKLRIGLLLNDYQVSFWVFKMIEILSNSNYAEISLVVKRDSEKKHNSLRNKFWNNRNHILYVFFMKMESFVFKSANKYVSPVSIKSIITCPEILTKPVTSKLHDKIIQEDIDKIAKHDIDIFIRLGFKILKGNILNCSKYGIWSYHHGDNKAYRGSSPGTWEVLNNNPLTGVTLQILNKKLDGGNILLKSYSSTSPFSISKNRKNIYKKSIVYLPRKVNELYNRGEIDFFKDVNKLNNKPSFYNFKLFKTPKNIEFVIGVFGIYTKWLKKKVINVLFNEQWIVLFKYDSSTKMGDSLYDFRRITPPKDRIWADPFIWKRDGCAYIFIEEMLVNENKGKISVMKLNKNGTYDPPQKIIEEDYHLSYPFLLEENNELFMIPESGINKTINLYKCLEFPYKWEFVKYIMNDIQAVDSTVFYYEDKYWLFANVRQQPKTSIHEELFLFFADNLMDENWTSHPKNPIVTDIRCSRPAGNIFVKENRIYRPSQNCAKRYGHSMNIQEIIVLNENDYEEKNIDSLLPNWSKDILCTHTLNHKDDLTVIDALVKQPKF